MNTSRPPLPRYYQIEQAILERIQQRLLQPGTQLPSETELAQQYQVSRITAKRVLDDLVKQGWAYRIQGRGTFVAQARIRDISGFRSFSEDIRSRGLEPTSKVLSLTEIEPPPDVRAILQLNEGELVTLLKRLRLANDEPVAVETAFLPSRICPGLTEIDFTHQSLYAVLIQNYQVVPTWADAEIEAREAAPEEAKLLNMPVRKPVLVAQRITYSASYDIIEKVTSVYRGDRFTFYSGRQFIG